MFRKLSREVQVLHAADPARQFERIQILLDKHKQADDSIVHPGLLIE
jgi:hypothetical protein